MSTKSKTLTVAALAAMAVPAAAAAHGRPGDAGKTGRDNATQQHARHQSASSATKTKTPKGVAFVVKGISAAGLTVTDGKLGGPLTLDPTSANKHARDFLALTKAKLATTDTVAFGTAGDAVVVKYVGLKPTDALQATDVVKVIGKVTRVRKGDTTTPRTLDIRKITVTRAGADDQAKAQTEQEKQGS